MATIGDAKVVLTMLEHAGVYPGDPPVVRVYSYFGLLDRNRKERYAVFYRLDDDDMCTSSYVRQITLLFDAGRVTVAGRRWLREIKKTLG